METEKRKFEFMVGVLVKQQGPQRSTIRFFGANGRDLNCGHTCSSHIAFAVLVLAGFGDSLEGLVGISLGLLHHLVLLVASAGVHGDFFGGLYRSALIAFHRSIVHGRRVFERWQHLLLNLIRVLDQVWTSARAFALLSRVMGHGVDEGMVSLGTDKRVTDNWRVRLRGFIQIHNSGLLRGNSVLEDTLLVLHPLELGSFLGLLIRELHLLGTLVRAHAGRQVSEPAFGIGNQVGVYGDSERIDLGLNIVFSEDF